MKLLQWLCPRTSEHDIRPYGLSWSKDRPEMRPRHHRFYLCLPTPVFVYGEYYYLPMDKMVKGWRMLRLNLSFTWEHLGGAMSCYLGLSAGFIKLNISRSNW